MAKSGMSDSDVESDDEGNCDEVGESADDSVCIVTKPVKTSTAISILIESLVKNLCLIYEPNADSAGRFYSIICEKLYQTGLIDESYNMKEFEVIRNQFQRDLHHLLISARGDQPLPVWPNTDVTNEWSHYYREFDEIEYIAGGGFGKVYRVMHKLDGTEYAVKKIFLRSEGIRSVQSYLSEVKTFASLNHSNIVQYKAAWLELGADMKTNMLTETTSESDEMYSSAQTVNKSTKNHPVDVNIYPTLIPEVESTFRYKREGDSSDFKISFENGSCITACHSSNGLIKEDGQSKIEKRHSISEGGNAICTLEEIGNIQIQNRPHPKWATLYIQMALCQSTLKQWLEKRNMGDNCREQNDAALILLKQNIRLNTIMEIFKQLLQGLEYIHSKSIVHHDIKPSNIFIQLDNGSLLVQLGDFGLACPLQSARHSLALGTKLYAAPEQLNGKCDPKSDMYSLGIVLLELVETFRTDMEKVRSITDLRKGHLSSHLLAQEPQLAHIISQLVVLKPQDRPNATTLLKRINVDVVESDLVHNLKCQIAEKDEEIRRLKQLLKTAGVTSD